MKAYTIVYFVRPECGAEDVIGPTLGPFPDYIQIQGDALTVGPNGAEIGGLDGSGNWRLDASCPATFAGAHNATPEEWHTRRYSDLVMWAELVGKGTP